MKELKFLGRGGALAVEMGGNCAYLKDDKTLLLIDCCEDAAKKLKDNNLLDDIQNIVIAITHTHSDHVSGLGTLIWQCSFIKGIKPKLVSNSPSFEKHLKTLLTLQGVEEKRYDFVKPQDVLVDGCHLQMMPTSHEPSLECYGIMFEDGGGKYYYTGDTNDFEFVKALAKDEKVKRIYCEASWESYGVHIKYDDLKTIKNDKFVLMHFSDEKLLTQAIQDGFNVVKIGEMGKLITY